MCGIVGFFSRDSNYFSKEDLKKMTRVISHRGPDATGYFINDFCGLGHNRLSILDLSERGNQPMISSNERFIIIYNGEVYNYEEIARDLNSKSQNKINFKTSTDTEVILEAFSQAGENFIHTLNGMFAFALYDKETNELYLYRDRLGIKPLFYYWDGINFAFASEIKSLLELNISKIINKDAIVDFLHLGYIPTPKSIYKNIYKLPGGSYIKFSKNQLELKQYWNLFDKVESEYISDEEIASIELEELLEHSIEFQMKSDVPYGIFLSGGIDSSLITAIAVKMSDEKINTFSIGFKESSHDESAYAKSVANYLKTNHYEQIVSYNDAAALLDIFFKTYDEPFADSSALPSMLVSQMASKHVKVILTGDGGDELFLGYGSYKWAQRLNNPIFRILSNPLSHILQCLPSRYKRISRMLNLTNVKNLKSHIFSQEQYLFSQNDLSGLLTSEFYDKKGDVFSDEFFSISSSGKRALTAEETQSIFDILYYLKDDLLTKMDRATMHYSIENRVPLLDHKIVEFALNLSPDLKIKNGIDKYLLKKILFKHIPESFFLRPKRGFSVPLSFWLKYQFRYLINEYLSKEIISDYNIVKYEKVLDLKDRFLNGNEDYLYNRIWVLIVLHKWLRTNNINLNS